MNVFPIALSLFLLMDPIGNIPLYIAVLKNVEHKRQVRIIARELAIALFVIISFSFLGNSILKLLRISEQTIMISGGIILFIMAIRMIFPPVKDSNTTTSEQEEPFIVPLAIPLIAGPSVLATVMIYATQESQWVMLGAITTAWFFAFLILITAPSIKKVLGVRGVIACERLMGLILTLLAVQMFIEGITYPRSSFDLQTHFFPAL